MIHSLDDFDPELAGHVTARSLEPRQHHAERGFITSTNAFFEEMIKFPDIAEFHCVAEFLHAGLLEGNPEVQNYVPQPFKLRVNGERYTADCFVLYRNGQRKVLELKPDGDFDDHKKIPLEHFFFQYDYIFEVVSNESIFLQRLLAENWLEITKSLLLAKDLDTQKEENNLLRRLLLEESCVLADIVDADDRENTYFEEIALYRLLHRGKLMADLDTQVLDYHSRIWRCH